MLVGITGNFSSGKSVVIHVFKRLGFDTFESDDRIAKLYKEPDVIEKIGEAFGKTITMSGYVDKELLSIIVFNNPEKLKKLNSLMHPIIIDKIKEIDHKEKIVFAEVPLLFEAHMEKMFDKIILVKCSYETCMKRAARRGINESEFKKRFSVQWPSEKKVDKVDYIIDSEPTVSDVAKEAEKILEELKGLK